MRKVLLFFLLGSLFTLSSCLDIVEEMYLNRDGSGRYTLTFDMSQLFSDPFMKGLMEEAMQGEGLSLKNGEALEKDTVIYMRDMPDSLRRTLERPEFWENVVMRMNMSESQKKMLTTIELKFSKLEDIAYFHQNLDQIGGGEAMGGGMMANTGFLSSSGSLFELQKKRLVRQPAARDESADASSEDMQFMKMFLSGATYKSIYHLPGKVKKVTIPNARVDGDVVTVETSYLDIIDGKAKMDGQIRFK